MTDRILKVADEGRSYDDDAEYLGAELSWLKVRVSRILGEKRMREAQEEEQERDPILARRPGRIASREARCRVLELKETEGKLRAEIDARLERQRNDRHTPPLGLDVVCHEADLGPEERIVLLVGCAMAVSQTIGEGVLQELGQRYGALSVSDVITVLEPVSIPDWLHLRKLFRAKAPLVSHGLVQVGRIAGEPGPDSLMSADIRLSLDAFAKITGDPDAATEGD